MQYLRNITLKMRERERENLLSLANSKTKQYTKSHSEDYACKFRGLYPRL